MKKISKILLSGLLVGTLFLTACGKNDGKDSTDKNASKANEVIKVGIVGESTEAWDSVKERLAKKDIDIEIVTFTDYNQPNDALSNGDLDLNNFQHYAFLNKYNEDKGKDLEAIAETVIAPLGIYSEKIKDVSEISKGDKIAIPNDPSNGGRALKLLETAGLIKVDEAVGASGTLNDIVENKLDLDIVELDAAQTARSLSDVTASVINSGMAVDFGLIPSKDAVLLESTENKDYINIIVARKDDNREVFEDIIKEYQTEETAKVIDEVSKGSQIPVWEK